MPVKRPNSGPLAVDASNYRATHTAERIEDALPLTPEEVERQLIGGELSGVHDLARIDAQRTVARLSREQRSRVVAA